MDAGTKAGEATAGRPKISFVGMQKRYAGKGRQAVGTLALDSFNFDLAPVEIVSIVGPTGCGKSTAMNIFAGFLSLPLPVAKASFERVYLQRPTYALQLDPVSPYSMTSKDGGLAVKYLLATQMLYETKSIPEPVPMSVIQDAIDPTYRKQFAASPRGK